MEIKLLQKIEKIFNVIMTCLLMLMTFVLALQIFSRALFSVSFSWVPELSQLSLIWMVFVGGFVLLFHDDHIRVDLIEEYLSERHNKYLTIYREVVMLLVISIITYGSFFRTLDRMGEHLMTLPWLRIGYIYLAMFIGFLLQGIWVIIDLINNIKGLSNEGN